MFEIVYLLNFLLIGIFFIFLKFNNLLVFLLLAEVFWSLLFVIMALSSTMVDSIILLSTTLFCLVVSGLEIGMGLLLYFLA